MKKVIAFSFLIFSFFTLDAQSWQWFNRIGGGYGISPPPDENINDMVVDSLGNVYVCGKIGHGASLNGAALPTYGTFDGYIAKFNCSGQVVWQHVIGHSLGLDFCNRIALDKFGNLYVSGYLYNSILLPGTHFIDTTMANAVGHFIAQLDTAGNRKWIWMLDSDPQTCGAVNVTGLGTDNTGKVYFCGTNVLACDVFPGLPALPNSRYIAKMDSLRNPSWYKSFNFNHPSFNPYFDADGSIYFTGYVDDSISIGSNWYYPVGNNTNMYACKFDSSGNYQWEFHTGLTGVVTYATQITTNPNNNDVWVAVRAGDNTPFGTFTVNNTLNSNMVTAALRLSSTGSVLGLWHGMHTFVVGNAVIDVNRNNVYFGSSYNGEVVFPNDSATAVSTTDMFLAQVNSVSGSPSLTTTLSGTGTKETPYCIKHDQHGNVYVAGSFDGTLTFNGSPIVSSGGQTDAFVAKFGAPSCLPVGIEEMIVNSNNKNFIYPNPTHDLINIASIDEFDIIEIKNIIGASVIKKQILKGSKEKIQLNVSALSPGIYFIQATGKNNSATTKFVKE